MARLSPRAGRRPRHLLGGGKRTAFTSPKVRFTVEERLKDMDAQGVDVQVVSIHTPFFGYHLDAAQGLALARDVNDEIAGMARAAARAASPASPRCRCRTSSRPSTSWSAR